MIGTTDWISKTGGNLSALERARLIAKIVALRIKSRLTAATERHSADRIGEIWKALPDSNVVRLALAECEESCSPAIFHHSCRTYFWAVGLAQHDSVRFDPEELALAALLHDLELGKTQDRNSRACLCFAGAGAATADQWMRQQDVAEPRRDAITQAIALHLNPGVPLSYGAAAHLLNLGATADVVGARMQLIPSSHQEKVLSLHPRCDFKREMQLHMQAERTLAPKTRAGFLMDIGFRRMIAAAPFAE